MTEKKVIPKLLFIDTVLFVGCILGDIKGQNLTVEVLEDVQKELSKGKALLLLPEVIKYEVIDKLKEREKAFVSKIKHYFGMLKTLRGEDRLPALMKKTIEKAKENLVKDVQNKHKEAQTLLNKIFEHENTRTIEITEEIFFRGCRRALIRKAPATKNNKNKSAFKKDQDCMAVESIINFLKENKCEKLVVCTRDTADYYEGDDLHSEVLDDLREGCNKVVSYRNLLDMLKEEFAKSVKKEDIQSLEKGMSDFVVVDSLPTDISNARPLLFFNPSHSFSNDIARGTFAVSGQESVEKKCDWCGISIADDNKSPYPDCCYQCFVSNFV